MLACAKMEHNLPCSGPCYFRVLVPLLTHTALPGDVLRCSSPAGRPVQLLRTLADVPAISEVLAAHAVELIPARVIPRDDSSHPSPPRDPRPTLVP